MICTPARGGDDQRRSSTSSGTSSTHQHRGPHVGHHQHHHQQQQQHQQGGAVGRKQGVRKKAGEEGASADVADRDQRRKRKQQHVCRAPATPTAGKTRQDKGGGDVKVEEEGNKVSATAPEGSGGLGGRKKGKEGEWRWERWERRVKGGVVGVEDAMRRAIVRREKFEAVYDVDPKPIATGMFTNIRKCRSKASGKEFAAKFSLRNRCGADCTSEIYHEVAMLSIVAQCPHVVHLCDIFETPQEIILVLEYAPGGDLQSIIDDNMVPFESDVVEFVRTVLEGLEYIHKNKIAHLDIKPQNLVMMGAFPDCDIKLCDFEISRAILPGESTREILGTPDYVAPEILHYKSISTAADMWSLGVTTYVLLTGFSPFGGDTDQETFCNIAKAQLDFPDELFEDVSEQAKDFIARLLVREPSSRPTASDCLKHPWISQQLNQSSGPSGRRFLSISEAPSPAVSCKDLTLLRRHLSKSREALFERVAGSNLRKALSRSRDRLCGSHLSLVARSRDTLHNTPSTAARRRSRDELSTLLSRSHEALALRDCPQKVGARPLAGFYGSMVDTNMNQGLEAECEFTSKSCAPMATNTKDQCSSMSNGEASPSQPSSGAEEVPGEGVVEDSDSEGTLRDWKEEGWATTSPEDSMAKICDSDGESDRERALVGGEMQAKDTDHGEKRLEGGGESKQETDGEKAAGSKEGGSTSNIGTAPAKSRGDEETSGPGSESQPSEPEEPRYTVAQLISVFNKRWESNQQPGTGRPPLITLPTMQEVTPSKDGQLKEASESKGRTGGMTIMDDEDGSSGVKIRTEGDDVIPPPPSQYLRSGSLSSETSGYETPSDASSMASWEEGISKQSKSPLTEKGQEAVTGGTHLSERRGSAQGLMFHHTWGMKVCDGSYNRAMSRFGNVDRNVEHKARTCKPLGEQTEEKSHRKCKPLVKPFL